MSRYRRRFVPGGTYFYTVCLRDRGSDLLVREAVALRAAFAEMAARHPVRVDAMVVLPDHLHAVWRLPGGDANYPARWKMLKGRGASRLGGPSPWQDRYWEHVVRDARSHAAHMRYCAWNPVKHGVAAHPEAWPLSSVHRDRRRGRVWWDP